MCRLYVASTPSRYMEPQAGPGTLSEQPATPAERTYIYAMHPAIRWKRNEQSEAARAGHQLPCFLIATYVYCAVIFSTACYAHRAPALLTRLRNAGKSIVRFMSVAGP